MPVDRNIDIKFGFGLWSYSTLLTGLYGVIISGSGQEIISYMVPVMNKRFSLKLPNVNVAFPSRKAEIVGAFAGILFNHCLFLYKNNNGVIEYKIPNYSPFGFALTNGAFNMISATLIGCGKTQVLYACSAGIIGNFGMQALINSIIWIT